MDFLESIGLGDADVLEGFHGDVALADVGGEIAAGEVLDFFGDEAGGDDAEGGEGEGDEGEFPVDDEHDAEQEEDGARFLDQVGETELEEVVEGGAVGFDPGDQFAGGGFLEEIEREGADFAEGVDFDVIGDALAAPGHEIAAAVAEDAAEDDGERDEEKAAEALFPIESAALEGKPRIDEDVEFLLEGCAPSALREWTHGTFACPLFAALGFAALFDDLLDLGGLVEAMTRM